jgi:predicted transcriptional regulator
MKEKIVKDLMIPLDDCAVVNEEATLRDAVLALDEAQARIPADRHPHRAVLVADPAGRIVGKIGQLAYLKGLESRLNVLGDLGTLTRAGVSSELISSMVDHSRDLQDTLEEICANAGSIRVKEVMHPITESVEESCSLREAVRRIVEWQQLSLLVTRDAKVVGLLRLSDLFETVARQIRETVS